MKYDSISIPKEFVEREWSLSVDSLKNEELMFKIVHVCAILFFSFLATFVFKSDECYLDFFYGYESVNGFRIYNVYLILLFDCLLMEFVSIYLAHLKKRIVFSKRKLIVFRANYEVQWQKGSLNLIFPKWTLEGAVNPFAIKMFNGFLNPDSILYTFLIVLNTMTSLILMKSHVDFDLQNVFIFSFLMLLPICCFRVSLCDEHENVSFLVLKFFAKLFRFPVCDNVEHRIYEAKVNCLEVEKRVNLEYGVELAVNIEDKTFWLNNGICLKSFFRVFAIRLPIIGTWLAQKKEFSKVAGGSTITMQMLRTLFFDDFSRKKRRKVFEVLFSIFWINKIFTKKEVVTLYLTSVTYVKSKMGLLTALKTYRLPEKLGREHWFFLIERLAYIQTQTLNVARVKALMIQCSFDELMQRKIWSVYYDNFFIINENSKKESNVQCNTLTLKVQDFNARK